jgi:hypothetical protein
LSLERSKQALVVEGDVLEAALGEKGGGGGVL